MMKKESEPVVINSITEFCKVLGHPKPKNPLLTVLEIKCNSDYPELASNKLIYDFYSVFIKKNIKRPIRYGRQFYDFSEGTMGFSAPKQVFTLDSPEDVAEVTGWYLVFHADLIRKYQLGNRINEFNFFSYSANEALHLSDDEEQTIEKIMRDIRREYEQPIDLFSQDVIVSYLDVLLNYSNRFYNRQFITRKQAEKDLLATFTAYIRNYFEQPNIAQLPNVNDVAAQMNVSAHYLSDMLRSVTGQSAQQHIHDFLIEKAKQLLLTTNLSVNETAYRLGFEYPQYFNRLFKNKTGLTPAVFRGNN